MNPIFEICKTKACGITITGLEYEDHQYSDSLTQTKYRFIDCVTVNMMIPVNQIGEEGDITYIINKHDNIVEVDSETHYLDKTEMEFPKDGLYRIVHMIIPTKTWYDSLDNPNFSKHIYLYNENKFYKLSDRVLQEIELKEILYANIESTAYQDSQYTFCTCRLQECFYKFCREYFAKVCSNKCISQDISNRDILWIGINTIKYLLDLGKYYEAQGVLESLTGCTGLCKQSIKVKDNGDGCRCSY